MRRTLLLPMLVVAVLAAAALAWIASISRSATREVERRVQEVRRAHALAFRLAHLTGREEEEVLALRFRPSADRAARLDAQDEEMGDIIRELGALDLPPRGRAIWEEVVSGRALRSRERRVLAAAVASGDARRVELAYARWDLATARSSALVADMSGFYLRRLERGIADIERVRTRSIVLLAVVLGASALVVLAWSAFVNAWLVRPVRAMTEAARRIASDRVALPVPGGHRRDELGVLARAMTRTAGELVRANAQLARSVAARDEFLSIASHELKTPLTALKLQLQNGARRWGDQHGGAPLPPWAGAALRQLDRVEALVAALLDLARIRTGRLTLRLAPADLAELSRGAAERLRDVLARAGGTLDLEVPERLEVECDAARIEQVLGNLLVNAAHHAPGSHVVLRARREGGRAVLAVEDDGPGIPEAARERVFAPYEKVDRPERGAGLGLGLHIARQIVEAHGGTIRAGGGPAGGAVLVVELPAESGAERVDAPARSP
jgi:signal transduction histidine kinase